jgi:5'-3' exonuclease
MTIPGLFPFLREKCSKCIKKLTNDKQIKEFANGKRFAIDTAIFMYAYSHTNNKTCTANGNIDFDSFEYKYGFLIDLLFLYQKVSQMGGHAIFVLDSIPPKLKAEHIANKRRHAKEKLKQKIDAQWQNLCSLNHIPSVDSLFAVSNDHSLIVDKGYLDLIVDDDNDKNIMETAVSSNDASNSNSSIGFNMTGSTNDASTDIDATAASIITTGTAHANTTHINTTIDTSTITTNSIDTIMDIQDDKNITTLNKKTTTTRQDMDSLSADKNISGNTSNATSMNNITSTSTTSNTHNSNDTLDNGTFSILNNVSPSDSNIKHIQVIPIFHNMSIFSYGDVSTETTRRNKHTELQMEEFTRVACQYIHITRDHYYLLQCLLEHYNIDFVVAPEFSDGEKACAELCRQGLADCVISNDTDTLAFGTPFLMVHAFSRKFLPEIYDLNAILKTLGLTFDMFQNMCVMVGSDYSNGIKGIGCKRAHQFIQKHKTIRNFLMHYESARYREYVKESCKLEEALYEFQRRLSF